MSFSLDDFYPDNFEQGQDETLEDIAAADYDIADDIVFDRRHQRMDVKKPGPFFEASPNNFYLDKLAYRYDTDDNDNVTTTRHQIDNNDNDDNAIDINDNDGQQEYEFPMSTSEGKDKRAQPAPAAIQAIDPETDYVHIALNNK